MGCVYYTYSNDGRLILTANLITINADEINAANNAELGFNKETSMNRITVMALSLVFGLGLTACGDKNDKSSSTETNSVTTQQQSFDSNTSASTSGAMDQENGGNDQADTSDNSTSANTSGAMDQANGGDDQADTSDSSTSANTSGAMDQANGGDDQVE